MKIRYHHLLCIPRFEGKGYSDAFCVNMQNIKNRFETEKRILVEECDDVCIACPNCVNGKCLNKTKVARYDNAVKQALKSGEKPLPKNICSDCQWFSICKNKEI